MFGNEKVINIGTSKMIILQQPRIGKSAELYTHMPSGTGTKEHETRALAMSRQDLHQTVNIGTSTRRAFRDRGLSVVQLFS